MLHRLGLRPAGEERDDTLVAALFAFLEATRAPFEQTFFDWRGGLASRERAGGGPSAGLYASPVFAPVEAALEGFEAIADADAGLDRPYFARTTPCTLLIDEVEAIWAAIADADDWSPLAAKLAEIREMAEAYGTTGATSA